MSKESKLTLILACVALVVSFVSLGLPKQKAQPEDKPAGGTVHNVQEDFTAGVSIGGTEVLSSARALSVASAAINGGTSLTYLKKGTCNLIGTPTIVATSTQAMDCSVSGVVVGDTVFVQLATTTPSTFQGWRIMGANASSTSGYLTVKLSNQTGADAVPPITVTSSVQYLILR